MCFVATKMILVAALANDIDQPQHTLEHRRALANQSYPCTFEARKCLSLCCTLECNSIEQSVHCRGMTLSVYCALTATFSPSLQVGTFSLVYVRTGYYGRGAGDDDDVGLHVLGCRVDMLGTNCNKLLKLMMNVCVCVCVCVVGGGGGGGVASASVHVIMSIGQQGAFCWIKKTICRWECILLRIKNDDHLLTAVNGPVMRAAYI